MIKTILTLTKAVASIFQIGGVSLKAPVLVSSPDDSSQMYIFQSGTETIRLWKLKRVICSSLYGGAIINQLNETYGQFLSFPWGKELHFALSLPYIGYKSTKLKSAIFAITPEAKGNYYHWMIDLLPRLMLLKDHLEDFFDKTILLHTSSPAYELQTLQLCLGIDPKKLSRIGTFQLVEVDELLLTDLVHDGQGKFPQWKVDIFKRIRSEVLNKVTPSHYSKVYLLRGNTKKRQLIGEQNLTSILEKEGFHIFDPSKFSFLEQINVFANARIILAPHGAALTNIVFCQKGAFILEIRSSQTPPEFYSNISAACRLQFDTIVVNPLRALKKEHQANKQHLVLTNYVINAIINKVQRIEVIPFN